MEVLKCVHLDTLVSEGMQHAVQVHALTIILLSCVHFGLERDEQNHHLLKNRYFQSLPRFQGALHFDMLPRMEPSSDAKRHLRQV
jgi:hypothetical protein